MTPISAIDHEDEQDKFGHVSKSTKNKKNGEPNSPRLTVLCVAKATPYSIRRWDLLLEYISQFDVHEFFGYDKTLYLIGSNAIFFTYINR